MQAAYIGAAVNGCFMALTRTDNADPIVPSILMLQANTTYTALPAERRCPAFRLIRSHSQGMHACVRRHQIPLLAAVLQAFNATSSTRHYTR